MGDKQAPSDSMPVGKFGRVAKGSVNTEMGSFPIVSSREDCAGHTAPGRSPQIQKRPTLVTTDEPRVDVES
jgi:hypothetical protein